MKKSELIYVIVRLGGVIFLVLAAWSTLNFVSGVIAVSGNPAATRLTSALGVDWLIRTSVEIIAGLYLVIGGGALFAILNREND